MKKKDSSPDVNIDANLTPEKLLNELYEIEPENTYEGIPLIPLRGISLFPHMMKHFDVGRPMSILALEAAMATDQRIFLVLQKDSETNIPTEEDFYTVGNVVQIKQMLKLPGDSIRVLVESLNRGEIRRVVSKEPYYKVDIDEINDNQTVNSRIEAMMRRCVSMFADYSNIRNISSSELLFSIDSITEPGVMSDLVASQLVLKPEIKQELLETFDPAERLERLLVLMATEIEVIAIEKELGEKVKAQVSKSQREYYLREQIKVIRSELGEDDEQHEEEIKELRAKLKKLKFKKIYAEKIEKEIDRYSRLSTYSAESGVIRTYVTTILGLPWNKTTKEQLDLKKAEAVLEEDHYGLEKVKERILEHLAVKSLTKNMKGQIICLVGPPGVGKTSVAKSIARSIGRKFTRMSLGGVRDEAEIRGHRRTYIGAIPGRIINGIREVDTKNPLFLLDEIDKLASDFRGDPSSALLEVLDPEQNKEFTDHYLEMPFDLSDVMFVTTANTLNTIPTPLLDRMEVIEVSGYTELEKLNIAKKYLIPKKLKEHGLKKGQIGIGDDGILEIIRSYTRESGVRSLERKIADICRKAAVRIVKEKIKGVKIYRRNLEKYLGKELHRYDLVGSEDQVGIVTGLAWTSVGGETLSIEVNIMDGDGKLKITGQIGDVMKESADAAVSYIRSITDKINVDPEFYKVHDIHIHIPEGAIPKDGPSAGITIATAVISALTGVESNRFVAMTGEITLRGRVLGIGGLKEKSLAGMRAGIKKILYPKENKKDYEELPDIVKKNIEFTAVDDMMDVLKIALKDPDAAFAKTGAAKTGAAKTGAAKTGAAKTEAAKTEAAKTGAAKTGTAKTKKTPAKKGAKK